jgi:RimJ/RimL family protein N-acetyltransferase
MNLELDPEVMRFLNGGHAVDHEQIDLNATFLMPRGTEPYVWTARRTTNGAFVGWFCLCPESETLAELGYRLRRMDWGQGSASEGASALVNWGFRSGGYDKIVATTMTVNHASRRVMEKIGLAASPIPAAPGTEADSTACSRVRPHKPWYGGDVGPQ